MPTDESQFLHELETEIEAELAMAQPSQPADAPGASPAEWLFDPTDLEREEIGLRNLLGAVIALESDSTAGRTAKRLVGVVELADLRQAGPAPGPSEAK